MKLTKTQLKEMVDREINKQLNEGMAVDEKHYFELKARHERDFKKILELADRLEDLIYDEDHFEDPFDLLDEIKALAGKHIR